ncbi:YdcF family protein [Magnetococcus sp. PR-3]|uniref:YdcF family protein n=1 Tax=Magnetococcus sp. PR-3 TaxID=3120355 RepID=UPI002FCE678B
MTSPLFNSLIKSLIFPPGNLLILMVLAYLLINRWPRLAKFTLMVAILALYIQSAPWISEMMVRHLESHTVALTPKTAPNDPAQLTVVLGCGRYPEAPEYGGKDTLSTCGLSRVRYGAYLYRMTGRPILVAGGMPYGEESSEADAMAETLEKEFRIPVMFREGTSRNTWENAKNTAKILKREGLNHIFLVTHAKDMRRAAWSFRQQGIRVTEAPTLFKTKSAVWPLPYLPNNLSQFKWALHEMVGMLYYQLTAK